MSVFTDILYAVANTLFSPVLLLLVGLGAWTVFLMGQFLAEVLQHRRAQSALEALYKAIDGPDVWTFVDHRGLPRPVREYLGLLKVHGVSAWQLDRHLENAEAMWTRRVEICSLISKVGPMLGLAGTLIPLGPALLAVGSGDLHQLGQNLSVSFTSTVVGLAIAGPCFAIALTRRRWYAQWVRDMEYLHRALAGAA